ncbi:MAG TPA: alpha/beta hydrolase [Chitinophaga sp.]|uniref:alpha/beta hydrolase n=1 Tax=Chitinophaga sp. TaxID=1869181 RepID=UPI002DBEC717|nr:alpha/beta hydrolase [Chitinophaga sp.]HEU4552993.1 alpha/beta hydrolase [Chitinophaga sp.]
MKSFFHDTIHIPVGKVTLEAVLTVPEGAMSIVIFSLASSRSRYSRRYQKVAHQLQLRGFGTLLVDLLTNEEDAAYYYTRTNIELLTRRLTGITKWLEYYKPAAHLSMGYFAAGTGAAAALKAACGLPHIHTVVCQGGRPDMAADLLPDIEVPVLLIAGTLDADTLGHSQQAFEKLQCRKKLLEIKGAGQLFVENNAMSLVMENAINWFNHYLKVPLPQPAPQVH